MFKHVSVSYSLQPQCLFVIFFIFFVLLWQFQGYFWILTWKHDRVRGCNSLTTTRTMLDKQCSTFGIVFTKCESMCFYAKTWIECFILKLHVSFLFGWSGLSTADQISVRDFWHLKCRNMTKDYYYFDYFLFI